MTTYSFKTSVKTIARRVLLLFIIWLVGIGASAQQEASKAKVIDPANMDFTSKPGDDFRNYSGGIWLRNNPVPAKETNWGSFTILRDFNVKAVREILIQSAADKSAAPGSLKKRVGDFYAAAMDSVTINKLGFAPIQSDYQRAGAVQTTAQVIDEIVYQRTNGIGNPLFGFLDRKAHV